MNKKFLVSAIVGTIIGIAGLVMAFTGNAFAQSSFWQGSVPVTSTESLKVSYNQQIIDSGYAFPAVSIPTGNTVTYVLNVSNTGTTAWTVTPVASVNSVKVTATWDKGATSIPAAGNINFTLSVKAISADTDVLVTLGFEKAQ